jgi:plasmid stabilization system protein ParE
MKRIVKWSRAALDDLKAQIAWIARDNPAAARRVAASIRATGQSLANFDTGHPGRMAETYEKSVRGLPYIIAYAVDRSGEIEEIVVVHVIHSARDWREGKWPEKA